MPDLPPRVPRRIGSGPTPRTTTERGYGTRWQKIRAQQLAAYPLCQLAIPGVCCGWADSVHHIDHDTTNDSFDNLKSTCGPCHLKHHANHRQAKQLHHYDSDQRE